MSDLYDLRGAHSEWSDDPRQEERDRADVEHEEWLADEAAERWHRFDEEDFVEG